MSFFGRPFTDAKKLVSKATNSKVAKAVPGGNSIGKSIRNAPGMKMAPKPAPATGGLAPSAPALAQQLPMMQEQPTPEPVAPSAPMPPMQDAQVGMSQPMVMPRNPASQPVDMGVASGGLGPSPNQNQFAALAQRMGNIAQRRRPMM